VRAAKSDRNRQEAINFPQVATEIIRRFTLHGKASLSTAPREQGGFGSRQPDTWNVPVPFPASWPQAPRRCSQAPSGFNGANSQQPVRDTSLTFGGRAGTFPSSPDAVSGAILLRAQPVQKNTGGAEEGGPGYGAKSTAKAAVVVYDAPP
jgi:hypothetical protein